MLNLEKRRADKVFNMIINTTMEFKKAYTNIHAIYLDEDDFKLLIKYYDSNVKRFYGDSGIIEFCGIKMFSLKDEENSGETIMVAVDTAFGGFKMFENF